jgi:hypothetical protein
MATQRNNADLTRTLYEKNPLLKHLNWYHPKLFRLIWEAYLTGLKLRATLQNSKLPLHPTTPIIQAREWAGVTPSITKDAATDQRILFFSFTGWSTHMVLDGLLGKALTLRGAEVSYFTCGGILPLCNIHNVSSDVPPMPCGRCRAYADSSLEAFHFEPLMMKDLVSSKDRAHLEAEVTAIPDSELLDFKYDGLPIGYFASVSTRWFMITNQMDGTPEMRSHHRKHILLGLMVNLAITKLIASLQPDKILMVNGLQVPEQVVRSVAARSNIPCIYTERGYLTNTFIATHHESCALYPLESDWEKYRDQPLSTQQVEQLDAYLVGRRYGHKQMDNLWADVQGDENILRTEINLPPGRPLVAAFTNVCGDTALIDRDLAYPDIVDWIDHLIAIFSERPDTDLVIRVHPAETRIKRYAPRIMYGRYITEHYPHLPTNIKIIPSASTLSSYTLAELSDFVMVYASTMGLETVLMNKPTTVAAQVHYRDKGFTCNVNSPEDLPMWVDRWTSGELLAPNLELARRYAYLFYFRKMIPLDELLEETTFGQMRLKVSGPDDLLPGYNRVMDTLCNAILNGQSFLNPFIEE